MQVPPIPTLSSIIDDNAQNAIQILINYLNNQDLGIQPWSKMLIQGFFQTRANTISASYSISELDQIVLVDSTSGTITVTLPSAVTMPGRRYTVKDWKGQSATNNITVATVSSQKIDGSSAQVLSTNYQAIEVASDGANWAIISNK